MTVQFTAQMALAPGDSVWLGLPDFSVVGGGGAEGAISVTLTGMSSDKFVATWENATEERRANSLRLHVSWGFSWMDGGGGQKMGESKMCLHGSVCVYV